ncbi:hypothetical protein SERLA73DRAFT_186712 [Serpula lacrymans var. lacrymans S7.3]|uniref:DUF6593 domain-containing protein n=2 Tax=Serpula lacrymans var. lacrymans TaxID=341189 RepID=F8Q7R7_SERL3|nr:uncharacterized protein SERLADRAFT_475910 [Serpula lacrymans var. lacrymans S7.9]EGN95605.1 hypothetical protein SERLA73DRAFT_186712 [Serpula lacrymans var. lacrymans S7.3]EGO21136.1 hypothetical protein SERLADRAFT_475910 [Serpula lacrymans var. lacrymans S7.9]
MRLFFSSAFVRNVIITSSSGQVLYKVSTPLKAVWGAAPSTIWKISPNSASIYRTNADYDNTHIDGGGREDEDDQPDDDEVEVRSEEEGENQDIDMQDHFTRLAEIERRRLVSSRIRWFDPNEGVNGMPLSEVETKDFIPTRGFARRKRIFTGPDGRSYRWDLGQRACSLRLDSDDSSKAPIARYHRRKIALLPGSKPQQGYLEINPGPPVKPPAKQNLDPREIDIDRYTDYELESSLDVQLDANMLDIILVTFIYVEKLRREKE